MATPIYVATAANGGSDTNDGTTPTDQGGGTGPKLTIQAAYGVVDASGEVRIQYGSYDLGDGTNDYLLLATAGKHVDIVGYNGGSTVDNAQVVIQGSIGAGAIVNTVYVNSSGNVLFRDLTIQTATTVNTLAIRWRAAAGYSPNLTLDNVIVLNQSSAGTFVISADEAGSAGTRVLTITDSVLTAGDHPTVLLEAFAFAYLTDSTFTIGDDATGSAFRAEEAGEIIAKGCTFTCTTAGISAFRKDGNGSVSLNNCTLNNAAGDYVLQLGIDAATATNPIDRVSVENCTIQYTGATGGHAVLFGPEVSDAVFTNNYASAPAENSSTNLGMVLKSNGCNITGNIILSERPLYMKGNSDNNLIENNTMVAWGTASISSCLSWGNFETGATTYIPQNSTIKNNIMQANNGKPCVVMINAGGTPSPDTGPNGMVLDYNCIYGTTLLSDVPNSNTYTTKSALTTFWGAQAGFPINNDLNSLNVNPQLNSNYEPQNNEVLTGGKPDANDNETSMGAIHVSGGVMPLTGLLS